MLCDDLEGWAGGGWEGRSRGRGYMCTYSSFTLLYNIVKQLCVGAQLCPTL